MVKMTDASSRFLEHKQDLLPHGVGTKRSGVAKSGPLLQKQIAHLVTTDE